MNQPTVVDAKLLESGCADAEGNDFDHKYAEGGQKSQRQGVRLHRGLELERAKTNGERAHIFLPRRSKTW